MLVMWWIILGVIAGWITGKFMQSKGAGSIIDILLGIGAALVGGWIMRAMGRTGQGGTAYTIVAAIVAAVVLTMIFRAAVNKKRSSEIGRDEIRRAA